MSVTVRTASERDVEFIRQITWRTWLDTYRPFIPEHDLKSYFDTNYTAEALRKLHADPDRCSFIAEVEGVEAGCARTKDAPDEGRFYLSSLYVLPEFQSQGVGARLLRTAEERARELGRDEIWLGVMVQNTAALEWYRGKGFQFAIEEPFQMGGTVVRHLIGSRKI